MDDFNWETADLRELARMRDALAEKERLHGITEEHLKATALLRKRGAVLLQPDVHPAQLTAHALSPDGRYLAVGSWCGDDYEAGGALQIWETATGRCVNVLDGVVGGIGWPGEGPCIQWAADGRRIAVEYNTNMVGLYDPFGTRADPPLGVASPGAEMGMNRPVGMALAPEGDRAFICCGGWDESPETGLWGNVTTFGASSFGVDADDTEETVPMAAAADLVQRLLDGGSIHPDFARFSADGTRLWGYGDLHKSDDDDYGRFGAVFCVDVKARRLEWFHRATWRGYGSYQAIGISPGERLVTFLQGTRLLFIDAVTGAIVSSSEGHREEQNMFWGGTVDNPRLAVIDLERRDAFGIGCQVRVYRGIHHQYAMPIGAVDASSDCSDLVPWAWSPDGSRAAVVAGPGQIELCDMGADPGFADLLDVPEETTGVFWTPDDVIVAAGPTTLKFFRLADRAVLGEVELNREIPAARPLESDGFDLGVDFDIDPTFALDAENWASALEEGVVITGAVEQMGASELMSKLDSMLAWSIERRLSWPYRWGVDPREPDIYPSVASAFDRLSDSSKEFLAELQEVEEPPVVKAFPPPQTATLDDVYAAAIEALGELDDRWDFAVSEDLKSMARLKARSGNLEGARDIASRIGSPDQYAVAMAELAFVQGRAGDREGAAESLERAASIDPEHVHRHNATMIYAAFGAAHEALGDREGADRLFAEAEKNIEPENNAWQNRLEFCRALLECGRTAQAADVIARGPAVTDYGTSPSCRDEWLVHTLTSGHREFARQALFHQPVWFDEIDAFEVLTGLGEVDLFIEYLSFHDRYPDPIDSDIEAIERAKANAARGAGVGPTETDLMELQWDYDELMRTPRSNRRHDTVRLIHKAGRFRHYSAVLDLLPQLPNDNDYNSRCAAVVGALWRAHGFEKRPF
jgi:tetratricopeptide (TPR) repeat protein